MDGGRTGARVRGAARRGGARGAQSVVLSGRCDRKAGAVLAEWLGGGEGASEAVHALCEYTRTLNDCAYQNTYKCIY